MSHADKADKLLIKPAAGARPAPPHMRRRRSERSDCLSLSGRSNAVECRECRKSWWRTASGLVLSIGTVLGLVACGGSGVKSKGSPYTVGEVMSRFKEMTGDDLRPEGDV